MEPRAMINLLQHEHRIVGDDATIRLRHRQPGPDVVTAIDASTSPSPATSKRRWAWLLRWRPA